MVPLRWGRQSWSPGKLCGSGPKSRLWGGQPCTGRRPLEGRPSVSECWSAQHVNKCPEAMEKPPEWKVLWAYMEPLPTRKIVPVPTGMTGETSLLIGNGSWHFAPSGRVNIPTSTDTPLSHPTLLKAEPEIFKLFPCELTASLNKS